MGHIVLCKRGVDDSAWPIPELPSDGRLAIQTLVAPFADPYRNEAGSFKGDDSGPYTVYRNV